jgi:chemotaxis response regulator CheB
MNLRIAIVNDDNAHMLVLRHIISSSSDCEIAWTATNGKRAVEKAALDTPDMILMDLLMPVMNGIDATRNIMSANPCAILIVTASVAGNASMVFRAMGAGALDAVNTPLLEDANKPVHLLQGKIDTVRRLIQSRDVVKEAKAIRVNTSGPEKLSSPPLIVIGTSTGGPAALNHILSLMPADIPAPIAIVQHIDQYFSGSLAEWLNNQSHLKVVIAKEGTTPEAGVVYLAASEFHMVVRKDQTLGYIDNYNNSPYCPSVDIFFKSVAEHWQGKVVAALLTGMGRDGASGLLSIYQQGGYTLAQDKESSTVFGMPKAGVEIGATTNIFPLNEIPEILLKNVESYSMAGD